MTPKRGAAKEARLHIVAKLYGRGYSMRQIRTEVMKRLGLATYSTKTVHDDIHTLLREWREDRIEDMDEAIQLELTRIDNTCRELWEQWDKSKENYNRTSTTRKAAISRNQETGQNEGKPYHLEEHTTEVVGLGDVAYISEIRQQLTERRKLLGLYAPEKKQVTGDLSVDMSREDILAEIDRIKRK